MLENLLEGAGRSIVFGGVGIGLMALGFVLVDLLTPGKLRDLIWVRRTRTPPCCSPPTSSASR